MAKTKKIQTVILLEPDQAERLQRLHEKTRVAKQIYLREAVEAMLTKYERKGVI